MKEYIWKVKSMYIFTVKICIEESEGTLSGVIYSVYKRTDCELVSTL